MSKQEFAPYYLWEDWQNGMYRDTTTDEHARLVESAAELLCCEQELEKFMLSVVAEWSVSASVNLTDDSSNHRPWIGQAACCMARGCTEIATREAWGKIGSESQKKANAAADRAFRVFKDSRSNQLVFNFE